jgi:hypothetical protein
MRYWLLAFLFIFPIFEVEAKGKKTVTPKQVKVLREKVKRKYHRQEIPFSLLPHVIGRINYIDVSKIVSNWLSIPVEAQEAVVRIFREAKLEDYIFIALLESKADYLAKSNTGDFGLFQINGRTGRKVCKMNKNELLDPVMNARCAVKVLRQCGRFKGWQARVICYNGKLEVCPWKGYQSCLYKKWRAGEKYVATSLFYPIKFVVYQEIGRQFIAPYFPKTKQEKKIKERKARDPGDFSEMKMASR